MRLGLILCLLLAGCASTPYSEEDLCRLSYLDKMIDFKGSPEGINCLEKAVYFKVYWDRTHEEKAKLIYQFPSREGVNDAHLLVEVNGRRYDPTYEYPQGRKEEDGIVWYNMYKEQVK